MSALKDQLNAAVKDAMRAKDKARLGTLRMATAAIPTPRFRNEIIRIKMIII